MSTTDRPVNAGNTEVNQLDYIIRQYLARHINTLFPVSILTVNPDKTLTVQPVINDVNSEGVPMPPYQIYNVPTLKLAAGGAAIILEPQIGDIGIVACQQRDISNLMRTRTQTNPETLRQLSQSDAVYIGSLFSPVALLSSITVKNASVSIDSPAITIEAIASLQLLAATQSLGDIVQNIATQCAVGFNTPAAVGAPLNPTVATLMGVYAGQCVPFLQTMLLSIEDVKVASILDDVIEELR